MCLSMLQVTSTVLRMSGYGSLYLGCDRPERIRLNMDMVLHPGFDLTTDQSRPLLLRQRSKLAKVCF